MRPTWPTIADAKRLALEYRKLGVVVLSFGDGQFGTASYGMTRAECDRMRRISERIFTLVKDGTIALT